MAKVNLFRRMGIDQADAPEHRGLAQAALIIAACAVAVRFFFWWYTGRIWEDALITVEHSENFVLGLGMTHHQPLLHGFTSPLSVLVPLMGDIVHVGFGISFIRLVSAFAGGLAVLFVLGFAIHPKIKLPAPLALMGMGYVAFEHHQILWGMSGMETELVTCILLMTLYFSLGDNPWPLGISLGLCMLARPDFAFFTAIVGMCLLRNPRLLVKTTLVALAVYAPWIIFTTLYYGSPIPNTVYAKGLGYVLWTRYPNITWPMFIHGFVQTVQPSAPGTVFNFLGPSFGGHGVGPYPLFFGHGIIVYAMLALNAAGIIGILARRQWAWLPAVLFVVAYTVYYIFFVPIAFGWYLVPYSALMVLLAARGIQAIGDWTGIARGRNLLYGGLAAAYLLSFVVFLPRTFATEKAIQRDIEAPVRQAMGQWLGKVMGETETVGCEPLGYVGYYSRRKVYDWPGLANREVVDYSRAHPDGRTLFKMLECIRPDFLVLRYQEYSNHFDSTWIDTDYKIIASFEADPAKLARIYRADKNIDLGFFVLARTDKPHPNLPQPIEAMGPNPAHSRACLHLGWRLANQNKTEEARRLYERALQLDPQFADAHNMLGTLLLGIGQADEAIIHTQKACELAPDNADAANSLGLALMQTGRLDEAAQSIEKAIKLSPKLALAYNNLGVVRFKQQRMDDAEQLFTRALKLDPAYIEAYKNIAGVYAARGDFERAAVFLHKAVGVDPAYPGLQELIQYVEQPGQGAAR